MPKKKNDALIVIDIQNYFLNENTDHLPKKIEHFIEKNRKKFNFVLFTKFINSKKSNFYRFFGWSKCTAAKDTSIPQQLAKFTNGKNVFVKNTFSAFKSKSLVGFLRKNKVNEVYLCGTDSDACILASAYDAFDLGFAVHVIKDLCGSCNGENYHDIGRIVIERNLEKRPI